MSCKITYTIGFAKELKRLARHYKSMKQDYADLLESLHENPLQGIDLGKGLRKVRMAITSKGKGKSGGARVITYTVLLKEVDAELKLLAIYDKAECESLSDKELQNILKRNGLL